MSNLRAMADTGNGGSPIHTNIEETSAWKDFLALIKVGIVNSNMITTFTGLWLALHFTGMSFLGNLDLVFFALAGSVFIIAGSCSFNNYYDRDIDHLMERTKNRPTVTGKVSPSKVLTLSFLLIAIGLGLLAFANLTTAVIGFVGVFAYIVLYTMVSKRRYVSNTIIGSISGAVPPLIGWAAVDPNLDLLAWALFAIMFLWQPPHFYALAMKRVEEYRAANVPMLPVVKGFKRTKVSIVLWVTALLFVPFLLTPLGTPLVVLAALLGIGWFVLGLKGFTMKDDLKWARIMFVYSLNYMTILFVAMVIVTLI
ncbi:heme o synthase [Peribacillus asahii]|uniref:heme o synthase n=1 Tax=Peribacillus TaxID=2675229 RepID=UPI002079DD42|nr:heme o synthase [Peribacillus asahii]USK61087.1 heme o synthase [Peribacillus asahii]USK71518.1 heme o synthase [Peribacillus asahii]